MTPAMVPGQLARLSAHLLVLLEEPNGIAHVCEIGSALVYQIPATWIAPERTVARADFLTARESEVLRAAATGCSNKQIAIMAAMSPQTVKNHLTSIYKKLRVGNRVEAVRWLLEQGA